MSLPRILSVEEVAAALGLCEATVRAMLRRGEIPGARLGGQWRIRETAIEGVFRKQESDRADVEDHATRVLRGVRASSRRRALVVPPKTPVARTDATA